MKPDIDQLIIYEDPHIIVCRKPAGVPVQSARIGTADMVSLLKNHLARAAAEAPKGTGSKSKGHAPYLAVIHRLDQPVEGLLVFAKTPAAAKELNRQLTSSGFGKYYRALVTGIPESPERTLEDCMVKDGRTNTSRICAKETPGAKPARLHYRVLGTYEDAGAVTSLVKIRLDTGRHHQIRVQMAHMGCPLIGDRKYGNHQDSSKVSDSRASNTLKLCAYRLEFRHPATGKEMVFELPADPEFSQ